MWISAVTLLAIIAGITNGDDWSYDYETQWPGQCIDGEEQSPINIMVRDAMIDKLGLHIRGPLFFNGYESVNASAANDGHTVRWTIEEDFPAPTLSGGPLRGNYTFVQFHLHWLSEHAINGMKYPMEIHMLHVKAGLTVDEALKRPDGLAVIGVLCQVHSTEESEFALEEIAPVLPNLVDRHTGYANASLLDLTRLFSPDMQSFFTYHGSLTTPNCQEVVTWIVMDKPLMISDTQYKLFSKIDVGRIDNYRSLQPVNRIIYRSVASSASVAVPGALGLLAALINLSASMTTIFSKGVCTAVNMKRKFLGEKAKECKKND